MDETRWLTPTEQTAWRKLSAILTKLPGALEAQLQRDADLSHMSYWVLALLSEEPDRTLPMSRLAHRAHASLSRLSHLVGRLEARGWVRRQRCTTDARVQFVMLTDAGYDKVVAAAPGHVAAVRRLVFDGLSPTDVADLDRVCAQLLHRLDPTGELAYRPATDVGAPVGDAP
ncbi:MAG TPA: MarR family transcriptional regulator [Pilimelia sp.]|nr:MarR family transcriptional regulator [Pilimelia sp.]